MQQLSEDVIYFKPNKLSCQARTLIRNYLFNQNISHLKGQRFIHLPNNVLIREYHLFTSCWGCLLLGWVNLILKSSQCCQVDHQSCPGSRPSWRGTRPASSVSAVSHKQSAWESTGNMSMLKLKSQWHHCIPSRTLQYWKNLKCFECYFDQQSC